jgi:hypothetical protein
MKTVSQAVLTLRLENIRAQVLTSKRTVWRADTQPWELVFRLHRACSAQQARPCQQAAAVPRAIAHFALRANTPTLILWSVRIAPTVSTQIPIARHVYLAAREHS